MCLLKFIDGPLSLLNVAFLSKKISSGVHECLGLFLNTSSSMSVLMTLMMDLWFDVTYAYLRNIMSATKCSLCPQETSDREQHGFLLPCEMLDCGSTFCMSCVQINISTCDRKNCHCFSISLCPMCASANLTMACFVCGN